MASFNDFDLDIVTVSQETDASTIPYITSVSLCNETLTCPTIIILCGLKK